VNQWESVGFSGSREGLTQFQLALLGLIIRRQKIAKVHHGDCVGADAMFHNLVKELGIWVIIHPPINPRNKAHGIANDYRKPLPYLDRNKEIVKESTILLACPKDESEDTRSGTWQTIRYARKLGRPTLVIFPSGEIILSGGTNV